MYFTKVGLIGFTPTCVVNLMIMKIEIDRAPEIPLNTGTYILSQSPNE